MDFTDKLLLSFEPTGIWLGALITLVLVVGYYGYFFYSSYFKKSPSLVPREEPPQQISPAASRFIWIHDFDSDCLISGIISAVVKDCYRIKWRNNSFSIYHNEHGSMGRLSEDERAALSFNRKHYLERLSVSSTRNRFTRKAEDRMQAHLKKKFKRYLLPVNLLSIIGTAFSLFAIFLLHLIFETQIPENIYGSFYLIIVPFTLIFTWLVLYAYHLKNWVAFPISLAFLLGGLSMIFIIESSFDHYLSPTLIPLLLVNYFSFNYLPRHTAKGRELVEQLEEFREYLTAKVDNDQKFERSEYYLIPYMIALEVPFNKDQYFAPLLSKDKPGNTRLPFSPF